MEENERTKRTTANTAVRTAGSPHMPGRGFSCGVPLRLTVRKENDRRQTSLFGGAGEERVRNVEAGVVGREGGEEARRTKGLTIFLGRREAPPPTNPERRDEREG